QAGGIEIDPSEIRAALEAGFATSRFNENPSHGFGGGGEEVAATVPGLRTIVADEAKVSFGDQGRGGGRLAGLFAAKSLKGELAEFVVDEGQELVGNLCVALLDFREDLSHRPHGRYDTARRD